MREMGDGHKQIEASDHAGLQAVRPVAPVLRAWRATKAIAKANKVGARAEGAPLGGGRAGRAGQSREAARRRGGRGLTTQCLAAGH